jgi:crossover junction endodeoxyribonuclease RuvC
MLVLGVDPGTALCGYGLVRSEEDELSLVAYGAVSTSANSALPPRLLQIYKKLSDLVREYRPDAAVVEKLFFAKNARTALAVGHARGIALLVTAQADLPLFEYTPNEVKQAIVGYGGADKRQMQQMVRVLLKLDFVPEPDDAADAIAIAICHLQTAHLREMIDNQK